MLEDIISDMIGVFFCIFPYWVFYLFVSFNKREEKRIIREKEVRKVERRKENEYLTKKNKEMRDERDRQERENLYVKERQLLQEHRDRWNEEYNKWVMKIKAESRPMWRETGRTAIGLAYTTTGELCEVEVYE